MIDGDKAIEYLKNKLINLINQGAINATYEESENTISFYISDIIATNRPLLSLRLSNHHENFNNRNRSKNGLPQGDDNLSIELYKPLKDKRNKVRRNVSLLYTTDKPTPIPFSVTTIAYRPWLMCSNDVNLIYQSILNWIKSKNQGATYIDPLVKTSRRAEIATHQANITPRRYVTQAEKNFYLRYGMGDSVEPRYDMVTETNNKYINEIEMNEIEKNVGYEEELHITFGKEYRKLIDVYVNGIDVGYIDHIGGFLGHIYYSNRKGKVLIRPIGPESDNFEEIQQKVVNFIKKNASNIISTRTNMIKKRERLGITKDNPDYYRIESLQKTNNTNMNKKLIRLTESDLHRIVKESVNKILTELDWKTYANAARKRYGNAYADNSGRATNRQELEKGNQLSQAANNAFQKQHGGTTINRASQPQQAGYYDPAKKDYQDYMNGKSKYVQRQGWQ